MAIEEGAHNICDAILENAGVEISVRANIEQTAKIYRTTPFNYAVSLEVNGVKSFYDSQKGNISIYQYIYIADGWYSTLRYICISDTQYFKDTYSTVLTFK